MELFKLHGTIDVDNSKANQALEETSQTGQKTQSKLGKVFSGIGKGALVVGKAVGTGLAVGGAAMGTLTVKALNLGGELEQNMGGSEAVFKQYAGNMQATAKEAFSNMGLSTSDYLATANKMGALFQGAGFSIKESMDISSGAMQRAADVASIMGIDTSAAMEAIAGAAKGNFTMMDNLGVAMNDTTLNAYALEKGINKTTQEMTNQEKIALAMEMFMDKTAYAAGNYAKENETLAGSLGTAKAALTNFLDGSGDVESLVTSFSNLANVVIEKLAELAPRLVSGITDVINQVIPMLPPLINQMLPIIIEGAVSLINGLVTAFPSIISGLMGALPSLIQGVQQIINALITALPQIIQALVSALPTLIPLLVNALVSMIVTLCTMLPQIIQPIIDYLPEIIISIVNALMDNLPALIEGCVALVVGIVSAIPQIILGLVNAMPTVIVSIVKGLLNALPILLNGWNQIWTSVKNALGTYVTALKDMAVNGFNLLKEKVIEAVSKLKDKCIEVFNNIKEKVMNAVNTAKEKVVDTFQNLKTNVTSKIDALRTSVTDKFNSIKEKIITPIENARDKIKGIVDKIKGFFSGMKISFPHISLPHFSISPGGWKIGDLLKGKIPKLSIKWYQEAMQNPMIMTRPTIFGYDAGSGQLMAGGEAGSEVVSGTSTLMRMIQSAVAVQNEAIVYYLQKIIEILADYFPQVLDALMNMGIVLDDGTLVGRLAPAMDIELGKIKIRKDRGR